MRAGAAASDVATVEALKQTLLNAGSVVNAGQVVQHVMEAQGNEIAFAPLPEILSSDPKRLQSVWPLTSAVQNYTSYSAVVMTGGNTEAAKDFVRYLTTPAAERTFSSAGVD